MVYISSVDHPFRSGEGIMSVFYLETGSTDPCYNLAFVQYVLEHRTEGDWLMLWQNANAVIIGRNQNTAEEINPAFIQEHGIAVVRRMTGGGAVYHDLGNLNYSFITDAGDAALQNLSRFTQPVCRALETMGVAAESSGRNDILVDGKKVSGVAQRVHQGRILHHGTLLFDSDRDMIAGALRADPAKFASKSTKSVRSRVGNLKDYLPEGTTIGQFWEALRRELMDEEARPASLTREELSEIRHLAESRYRTWEWNYGKSPAYAVQNRTRYPGGTLDVRMNVQRGILREIRFFGDFMSTAPLDALAEELQGVPRERKAVEEVLSHYELPSLFGTITEEEILSSILD